MCEDGGRRNEVQRRLQTGATARRRVEGIMWDRKLKKQVKGSVGSLRGTSLCMWVGITCTDRVTGGEAAVSCEELDSENIQSEMRRHKGDGGGLKEEMGMKKYARVKVVGSRLRWAGHRGVCMSGCVSHWRELFAATVDSFKNRLG